MIFHETPLKGAYAVELEPHCDDRGQFARGWCRDEFARQGIDVEMVQGNVSINPVRGTLRGLHWQAEPHGEAKLVRCVRGAIFDVIVDIDPASSTCHEWFGVELSPHGLRMLYIPPGFAHGFQTLCDDAEVNYLVSTPYAAPAGRGLRYDDPALAIRWPLPVSRISKQDTSWPLIGSTDARSASLRLQPGLGQ
ncbi:MAG: dTDP-4-dehydrorhamnose 3,5-epimerase family protein [Reyranella sp.]|uniref:dTDP-4-dehydrorhamnose 3,5-epimerase family protein n=1 Tax=Reyranella sp. TaxID=1929291 RepID=UPI003D0ADB47